MFLAKVKIHHISLQVFRVLEYSLFLIPILSVQEAHKSVEPNVFFVNDDTPAGHKIGQISQLDRHQNVLLTGSNSVKAVLLRGNRPPASYVTLDEIRGDLFTKVPLDREALCPGKVDANAENSPLDRLVPLPGHGSAGEQLEHLPGRRSSPGDCELLLQVALHRTTPENKKNLPEFVDVRVVILDRNDHHPTFHPHRSINISVAESVPVGTRLKLPMALDLDSLEFGIQRYHLTPSDQPEWAMYQQTVDIVSNGKLYQEVAALYLELRSPLDREKKSSFFFEVRAYDSSTDAVMPYDDRNVLKVYLSIDDTNDNGPVFLPQTAEGEMETRLTPPHNAHFPVYTAEVAESTWPKSPLVTLKATDDDSYPFSVIRYDFAPYVEAEVKRNFKISELTGEVFLRKPLDYEKRSSYSFDVLAIDSEYERRSKVSGRLGGLNTDGSVYSATARLVVMVKDVNDESPVMIMDYLNQDPSSGRPSTFASIEENLEAPQFVADLLVTDKDVDPKNSHISCHINQQYQHQSEAGGQHLFGDKEDAFDFQLSEVRRQPGKVQYNLLTGRPLDRELAGASSSLRRIEVVCKDSGSPVKSSQLTALVQVTDVNDNRPSLKLAATSLQLISHAAVGMGSKVDENVIYLYENTSPGSLVARLNVTDPDYGDNGKVICSFVAAMDSVSSSLMSYFHIDPNTCEIITQKSIDREASQPPLERINIYIEARDHGTPSNTGTLHLVVQILDENDNPPKLSHSLYLLSVRENLPVGTWVGALAITDLDGHCDELIVRYLKHENIPFQLWTPNKTAGVNISDRYLDDQTSITYHLNTTRVLDRELTANYEFKVVVIDAPNRFTRTHILSAVKRHTTTVTVLVEVEDENDNDPVIIFPQQANKTFVISSSERSPYQLITINVNDRDAAKGNFFFNLIYESSSSLHSTVNFEPSEILENTDSSFSSDQQHALSGSLKRRTSFLDIDRGLGTVYLNRDMTTEDEGLHAFHVVVQDTDSPPRSTSLRFLISVEPITPRLVNKTPHARQTLLSDLSTGQIGDFYPITSEHGVKTPRRESDFGYPSNDLLPLSERRPSAQSKFYLPRLTGDVVLILSLGLILLLLLATLCLVVYIRHWSSPSRTRSRPNKSGVHANRWFTSCCQRNSDEAKAASLGEKLGLQTMAISHRTPRWSPLPSACSGNHVGEPLDRSDAREVQETSPDDSTNTTMLHRLCSDDRIYYHDCRPFSMLPVYSIPHSGGRTFESSTFGKPAAVQKSSPYSTDYTALQSQGQACDCCTLPVSFEQSGAGQPTVTFSPVGHGERDRASKVDTVKELVTHQREELINSHYTPLNPTGRRSPPPSIVRVSSRERVLNNSTEALEAEGCAKLIEKPAIL